MLTLDLGAEADHLLVEALLDDGLQPDEGAPADEQDVRRVHLDELLMRVLAPALGRDVGHGPLDELEQGLLHALARDVPRDGGTVALAADLVDLVDVDDAALRPLHVIVGGLHQLEDDVLHVLPDVTRLGQRRRIGNGKRHVEDAGQRLGQ